jgi:hypothetical protein
MKNKKLFVLAGNQQEYLKWAKQFREEIKNKGFVPAYLPVNTINYLGIKDCFYTTVGTFYRSEKYEAMFRYFEKNNFTKI